MRTFDYRKSLRLEASFLLETVLNLNSFPPHLQKINKSIVFKGREMPFWCSDVMWVEYRFAGRLKGSVWSYLYNLTPSQRCHGLAKEILLKCNMKTEGFVGQYKAARGQLAVMGRVTVSWDQRAERSSAEGSLAHLRASCSWKRLAKTEWKEHGRGSPVGMKRKEEQITEDESSQAFVMSAAVCSFSS